MVYGHIRVREQHRRGKRTYAVMLWCKPLFHDRGWHQVAGGYKTAQAARRDGEFMFPAELYDAP